MKRKNDKKSFLNRLFVIGTAWFLCVVPMVRADDLISSRSWSYLADTVMGGVSDGRAVRLEDGALRLTGQVSTENNGGFIQVRTMLEAGEAAGKTGVRLEVRGNGETYFIHLRVRGMRPPWHYYSAVFTAPTEWTTVEIPFEAFTASSWTLSSSLNGSALRSLGIVAYGKDYQADILVRSVRLY